LDREVALEDGRDDGVELGTDKGALLVEDETDEGGDVEVELGQGIRKGVEDHDERGKGIDHTLEKLGRHREVLLNSLEDLSQEVKVAARRQLVSL
jgi:hypothetical protein